MNISEIIKWISLGVVFLSVLVMSIIIFVSKIGLAVLIPSLIALTALAVYKVIEILQVKGIIK